MKREISNLTTNGCLTPGMYDTIQEAYDLYIYKCISISAFTVLLYSIVLRLPQEIRYIWSKRSSLPVWLYIFTKYGVLISELLGLVVSLGLKRLCFIPNWMNTIPFILSYNGMQGLLIARTYAVSERSKILIWGLVIGCLIGIIASVLNYSTLAGPLGPKLLSEIFDASLVFTDLIAFWVSTKDVWITWKLKREAGIQRSNDITTILLRQSIIRCSLVVVFAVASAVSNQVSRPMVTHGIENFGYGLVAIMVADFILDIRQCNYAAIEASITTLPKIQFQSVLQYVQQSIIVELKTPTYMEERCGENDGIPESQEPDVLELGV